MAEISIRVSSDMKISGTASAHGTVLNTTRNFDLMFPKGNDLSKLHMSDPDSWSEHALVAELKALILNSKPYERLPENWFRGRSIKTRQAPTWKEMGPPEDEYCVDAGRYNLIKKAVLYLCESEFGVSKEVDGENIYVQKYSLKQKLQLFDSRDLDPDGKQQMSLIGQAFHKAECDNNPLYSDSTTVRKDYHFSNLLARLVEECGFDGFLTFGVRGSKEQPYLNLILFSPAAKWEGWCDQQSAPTPLQAVD